MQNNRSAQVGRVSPKAYELLRRRALKHEPIAEAQDDKRTRSQGRLATAAIIALCSLPEEITLEIVMNRLSGEDLAAFLMARMGELRAELKRRDKANGPRRR